MNKNELISLRTSLEFKTNLIFKAQALGMTLSEYTEFIIQDYQTNIEEWKENEYDIEWYRKMNDMMKFSGQLKLWSLEVKKIFTLSDSTARQKEANILFNKILTLNTQLRELNKPI